MFEVDEAEIIALEQELADGEEAQPTQGGQ
jgi:hypothetical protein